MKLISKDSNVDINAVKMLIMHLAYYNVITIADIFTFENRYKCTPGIKNLVTSLEL